MESGDRQAPRQTHKCPLRRSFDPFRHTAGLRFEFNIFQALPSPIDPADDLMDTSNNNSPASPERNQSDEASAPPNQLNVQVSYHTRTLPHILVRLKGWLREV